MTIPKFDCKYFAGKVNNNLQAITLNMNKYCNEVEKTLPSTITDSLRGFHHEIKPNRDYSATYLYFHIYLRSEVLCYHSKAELNDIITKATQYPFHIRINEIEPTEDNRYSSLKITIEFSFYRHR